MTEYSFKKWYGDAREESNNDWGIRRCKTCDQIGTCVHLYEEARANRHPDWPKDIKQFRCVYCNCRASDMHDAMCEARLPGGPAWKIDSPC
jgi:hypothetical protein